MLRWISVTIILCLFSFQLHALEHGAGHERAHQDCAVCKAHGYTPVLQTSNLPLLVAFEWQVQGIDTSTPSVDLAFLFLQSISPRAPPRS